MPNELAPILLAEDDPDDHDLFESACLEAGLANPIVWARDGQEAVERLQAGAPPALIILDLKMPRLDGLEVLRWIRAGSPAALVPVIVLTASARPEDRTEAYRLGANSFLVKPSRIQDLADLMRCLKSYWLGYNLAP